MLGAALHLLPDAADSPVGRLRLRGAHPAVLIRAGRQQVAQDHDHHGGLPRAVRVHQRVLRAHRLRGVPLPKPRRQVRKCIPPAEGSTGLLPSHGHDGPHLRRLPDGHNALLRSQLAGCQVPAAHGAHYNTRAGVDHVRDAPVDLHGDGQEVPGRVPPSAGLHGGRKAPAPGEQHARRTPDFPAGQARVRSCGQGERENQQGGVPRLTLNAIQLSSPECRI